MFDRRELIEAILLVSGAEQAGTSEMVLDALERMSTVDLRKQLLELATMRKWARERLRQNDRASVEAVRQHTQEILKGRLEH
jgi:hypothetical protein